jgi:hypothetical protein
MLRRRMMRLTAHGDQWLDPCLLASLDIRRAEITRVRQQRFGVVQSFWQGTDLAQHRLELLLIVGGLNHIDRDHQQTSRGRQSLQTHDASVAAKDALKLARLDDQIWEALRSGSPDIETARAAIDETQVDMMIRRLVKARLPPPEHHFSDALAIYLRKNRGRDGRFVENANRVFARVKDILGDRAMSKIKRADARIVLAEDLKTSSVKRYLAVMSAIYNAGVLEFELDLKNPFSSLEIPNFLEDTKDVPSFSETELRQIATAGLAERSEQGLIATMQIETGARVREIAAPTMKR